MEGSVTEAPKLSEGSAKVVEHVSVDAFAGLGCVGQKRLGERFNSQCFAGMGHYGDVLDDDE